MNSEELAQEVGRIQSEALSRILIQGKESYSYGFDEQQRFEEETLGDELDNVEDELLDTINWAAMAVIKLRERRSRLAQANQPPTQPRDAA